MSKGPGRKYNREPILTLWAAGETIGAIAMRVGLPVETVNNIIKASRAAGDRRATKRATPWTKRPRALGWA